MSTVTCTNAPVKIDLGSHTLGDKWLGIAKIGPVLVNGSTPDGALTRVRMVFEMGSSSFVLDSDGSVSPDAPITIDDAATWEARVPEVQSFLGSAGRWAWTMSFYEGADTGPLTFYRGVVVVKDY